MRATHVVMTRVVLQRACIVFFHGVHAHLLTGDHPSLNQKLGELFPLRKARNHEFLQRSGYPSHLHRAVTVHIYLGKKLPQLADAVLDVLTK